jgi:hypothetical protein
VTLPSSSSSLQSSLQQTAVASVLPTQEGHLIPDVPLQPVMTAQEMVLFWCSIS